MSLSNKKNLIANKKSELFENKNYNPSTITWPLSNANLDKFIH